VRTDRSASSTRWALALTLSAGGLALAAYGLFGLAVVAGDWMPCLSPQATASLNSLPAGYCFTTNWVGQFGFGLILTTLGVLGIVSAVLLVRRRTAAHVSFGDAD
jgi:hypothetical protein